MIRALRVVYHADRTGCARPVVRTKITEVTGSVKMEIEAFAWSPEHGSLIDLDVARDGNTVAATIKKGEARYLFWNEMEIKLPKFLDRPCVRFMDEERVLVIDRRTNGKQENAATFSSDGRIVTKFMAGDGIQDVGCRNGNIFVSYFDEGVFSGIAPSEEGVAIFNAEGELIMGLREKFGPRVDIVDCYCACWGNGESLWFCSYPNFPLVEWNLKKNSINILKLPAALQYPGSMSTENGDFFFFSPHTKRDTIIQWKPGMEPKEVGVHQGPLRGLPGGQFISVDEKGYMVIRVSEGRRG